MLYSRLTLEQSRGIARCNARMLALSRMRREFGRHCRATGWGPGHVGPMWDAHICLLIAGGFTL